MTPTFFYGKSILSQFSVLTHMIWFLGWSSEQQTGNLPCKLVRLKNVIVKLALVLLPKLEIGRFNWLKEPVQNGAKAMIAAEKVNRTIHILLVVLKLEGK